jgi:hypothetical protein
MATASDVMVRVVEADRDENGIRAVGGNESVLTGGGVGVEPLSAPGTTTGATASKEQKEKSWSPDEQVSVMEEYAMVSKYPKTGASQSCTEFAALIETRFLTNRRCPKKVEFEVFVGAEATTRYGRGAMACKAMAENIRSQYLAFTSKRNCVLEGLTTGGFSDDGLFEATMHAWKGRVLDRTFLYSIASGEKVHGIGKKFKLEAVYEHCVKDQQIK